MARKFLPVAAAQEPEALERRQREVRAASALNHPIICTLHDVGDHVGQPLLVTELPEVQSWKERLQEGPPSCGEAVDVTLYLGPDLSILARRAARSRALTPSGMG